MANMQNARLEPLAITGFSFKMPQSAVDEASLWNILVNGTNVMSEWPKSRANVDAHHDGGSKKPNTALVLGTSALLNPEISLHLANMNFLSPESRSFSFDARANGYARGEGVAALFIRPLRQAVQDGDVVRAVVRATASNQDGRTPGLTQPSSEAQEALIRRAYAKAGLELDETRYVEAHGTGTQVGDPIEANTIGRVLGGERTLTEPLFLGSIKANLGHLEGCSGPAGVIKAIMILERGIIPPQALFKTLNPAITAATINLKSGLRRVSVNSFGFGGANAHAILDDALHYMQMTNMRGFHHCNKDPALSEPAVIGGFTEERQLEPRSVGHAIVNGRKTPASSPQLLVWSAADIAAIKRMLLAYEQYYFTHIAGVANKLDQLAYTLAARRSFMTWRSFAVVYDDSKPEALENVQHDHAGVINPLSPSKPVRVPSEKSGVALVFTGQGAQYAGMGLTLLHYPIFEHSLRRSDQAFANLGCGWSIFDVIQDEEKIDRPEFSQPLCTALQIALVDLLQSFSIHAVAAVGHSSGEIAAAYAVGALTHESACKVAYFRGKLAGRLRATTDTPGAMLSANLREVEIPDYLRSLNLDSPRETAVHVACVNSPYNVTLAGPEQSIDALKADLDKKGTFAQKLNTGIAYHSPVMQVIAQEYVSLMGTLKEGLENPRILIVSSVTGEIVEPEVLAQPEYWVSNLVSPVQFRKSVDTMVGLTRSRKLDVSGDQVEEFKITDVIEVGPHSALRRSIKDTVPHARYHAWLQRTSSALHATLELVGALHCLGYSVSVTAVNEVLVVPGMGSLVIAIEAARQMASEEDGVLAGFLLKDAHFLSPLRVGETMQDAVETEVHLDRIRLGGEKGSTWCEIRVFAHWEGRVVETFNTKIHLQFAQDPESPAGRELALEQQRIRKRYEEIRSSCTRPIATKDFYKFCKDFGFKYGTSFEILDNISYDARGKGSSTGEINLSSTGHKEEDSPVHPALLDAVLQVFIVQASKGLDPSMKNSTVIPQTVGSAWISNRLWTQTTKTVYTSETGASGDDGSQSSGHRASVYAVADDGSPLCALENVGTAAISRETTLEDQGEQRKLLYSVSWKPRLSSLAPAELQEVCRTRGIPLDESDSKVEAMANFFPKIELALQWAADKALQTAPESQMTRTKAHYSKYAALLKRQQPRELFRPSDSDLEALLQECDAEYPQWSLFTTIAAALPSILRGEVDPRELMSEKGAEETFYASVYESHIRDGRFQAFVDLASHENPGLRILEVGAGTGQFTRVILSIFDTLETESGGMAFADYVCTDTSSSLLGDAQIRFKQHSDRLSYVAWGPEHDPADKASGLELESYDLIFAGSVLHATPNISKALTYIRKLLRPGGHLVLQELTSPQVATLSIGFGSLESWWNSGVDWRQDGPLATQQQWDQLLRDNCFSGVQLALKDFEDDSYHISTIMVATAVEQSHLTNELTNGDSNHQRLVVLLDQSSVNQKSLATELGEQHDLDQVIHFADLGDGWRTSPTDIVVSLFEVGSPRLTSLTVTEFAALQRFIQTSKNILWVTASQFCVANLEDKQSDLPFDPRYDVATGFLRTIRSEESDKHIVTLTIDQSHEDTHRHVADLVAEVLDSSFNSHSPHKSSELEYVFRDGVMMVGRMAYEKQLDGKRESFVHQQERTEPWLPGPPLALSIGQHGMLDSLKFVEDDNYCQELADDEVEMEACVWPISLRDVLIALGKIDIGMGIGYECAGTVTRVGSALSDHFQIGDRVGMGVFGSMRSHPRGKIHQVRKIPDGLSFEDGVSHGNPCMTAWQGLVNVAKLQKGEKVLIHSAAGATGQMAVQVAHLIGATVFATVGSDDKRELLVKEYNIPKEHIFNSRDTSFAHGIKRVTKGAGVDVILNSLAGDSLQASWECIAPYGRFIEIGKIDIMGNSMLPMAMFAKNVMFAAVDLAEIARTNIPLADELLSKAMELIANGSVRGPAPSHIYPIGEVEKAFRFMQSGKHTGRIMLARTENDRVTKHIVHTSTWTFDADASYVIVGGFGGLGRAMIEWMLPRDMDFFVLLSSLVGIYGALGQSNYAAGCAFQDALARARTDSDAYKGVSASLDLSWLVDAGIVAERADYRRKWETAHDFAGVEVADLLAVLDHCCDPSTTKAGGTGGQVLVGAVMPSDLATVGVDVPLPPNHALFKGFTQTLGGTGAGKTAVAQSISARFRAAETHETRREVVVGALQEKLARALGVEMDEVDIERPVSTYGVDSLMAVELRNWMRNDFGVEVLVFEILVGGSVSNLGEIVTTKAEDTRKETERKRVEEEVNGVENGTL
ncbi:Type I Iterative PKS [Diaporthe australafricana]|uniref:Type I Iterative PKS n=1 Tax=Diaporthe australafricana TaxID=127596 RepID=A0ABR3XZZ5_9PEZI